MADKQWLEEQVQWPGWAANDARYKRLAMLDLYLLGKQYNHLQHPFDKEEDNHKYIPMFERRPSAQYNIPGMVARQTSRKLFAGKHAPRLKHKNQKLLPYLQKLIEEAELPKLMPRVARHGSVGSSVITFKIVGDKNLGRVVCTVWDSKFCRPKFDKFRELSGLRVCYPAVGMEFLTSGYELDYKRKEILPTAQYWRIFDLDKNSERNYKPIAESDWNPNDPKDLADKEKMVIEEEVTHNLGIVPAHWFTNIAGGSFPDGACTWEDAIPMVLSLDYEVSQLLRAVNYCGSPQLAITGNLMDDDQEDIIRSPALTLQFEAAQKHADGETTGGGDAHLLEMTGQGISVGIALAEKIRMWALEQIGCARPDKNEIGSLVTGKAMELLDEDLVDLMSELRTAYGDYGYLPLVKKIATACIKAKHPLMKDVDPVEIDGLTLDWPKTFTPTPQESFQMTQAMSTAVGGDKPNLIEREVAAEYLHTHLDLPLYSANRNVHAETSVDSTSGSAEDGDNVKDDQIVPST